MVRNAFKFRKKLAEEFSSRLTPAGLKLQSVNGNIWNLSIRDVAKIQQTRGAVQTFAIFTRRLRAIDARKMTQKNDKIQDKGQ